MRNHTLRVRDRAAAAPGAALILALILVSWTAVPARADLGPNVLMRLSAPEGVLPETGQPFSFDLEITSATAIDASTPVLRTGRTATGLMAWEELSFPVPVDFKLGAMQPRTFPVQLLCNDPTQPIEIELQVGGRTTMQRFYLLPQSLNSAMSGDETSLVAGTDKAAPTAPDNRFARPEPAPVTRANVRDKRLPAGAKTATGRSIRVHGRFVYYRNAYDEDGNYVGDGRTMGADGVTVNVYDSDWEWDDLLAQTSLGPDGNFDITFYYDDAEDPDIYVEFLGANAKVDLVHPSIWNTSYSWSTPTKEDFTGTTINWGLRHPSSGSHYAGLNLLASATRSWRWLNANNFGGIDNVLISWPDSDWPKYRSAWETIYIPSFKQWYEGTVCHEYGHHWMDEFSEENGSDYCNTGGRCDDSEDCRHCIWCEETAGDAMSEGFPDWMSAAATAEWPSQYGFSALLGYDFEALRRCTDGGLNQFDDADLTEGMLAAFLQDLVDDNNETDAGALTGGQDAVTWSAQRILSTQGIEDALSPRALIAALRSRYPESEAAIWMAAANARYTGLDNTPPSALAGLTSLSHSTIGSSPDGTVELRWNAATDNYSGIAGYSVRVGTASGLVPDTGVETTGTSWTSDDLQPGTYWFTVRAVDRDGQGGTHASFGPVTIRAWTAANLEAIAGTWPYPLVPRLSADATTASAPLPSVLVGNGTTYFNYRIGNSGELKTPSILRFNFLIDGALWWYTNIYPLDGYNELVLLNVNAGEVKSGRHAVKMWADAYEQLAEVDETDNIFSRQFIWYPLSLYTNGTWVTRTRPSDAWGGFTKGLFSSPNCDGFAYALNTDPFAGAVMVADDDASDFDLHLHTHTTGPTSGFSLFDREASSSRPAGCVEAVFSNNSQTTETVMDVGVVNYPFDGYGFKIRRLFSTSLATNSDVQLVVSPIEPLTLRHFTLSGGSGTNHGQVTLRVDPAVGPVRVKVLPAATGHVALEDGANVAVTDSEGFAKVLFTYTGSTQGLVVWQDPRDIPAGGNGHFGVTVRAGIAPADLVPLETAGWYAPLVPTNGAPGTAASTPLPSTLVGNAASTYVNVQFRNDGAATAGAFDSMTYLDGTAFVGEQLSGLAGQTDRIRNFPYARTVRGGRHTLSMLPDATDAVSEGDELNNALGRQYVWSPLALAAGGVLDRDAPPDPVGGFAAVLASSAEPAWFNCDGFRTPLPAPSGDTGHWLAVATLPGAASDVDLRLHERINSTYQGFTVPIAASAWGPAESDYVLVNFRATSPRQFDVGAVGSGGAESYRTHTVASSSLGNSPVGSRGPFSLAASGVVALHEAWLPAGPLTVELHDLGGDDVDWGLTLHRGQIPFHGKSESSGIVGQAWIGGPGAGESMPVDVPQAGYYCLAVWKSGAADAARAGQYELRFDGFLSGTGDGGAVPARTAVHEITPNPFNPSTKIVFDLAAAGQARLEVFDVRGRLIRRLVTGAMGTGRHEIVWDGCDDTGVAVASGTYVARLRTADASVSRKMQLLK